MTCCDKNVIHVPQSQGEKNKEKSYMMMWHVIPSHINLGPCISML
jgi:hypothetical protein